MIALHWDVLRNALNQLGEGKPWRDLFEQAIRTYTQNNDLSHAQVSALWAMYPHFVEATMDFAQLQGIDILHSFRCTCEQPYENLAADAVAVSVARSQLTLLAPHYPRLEDTQVQYGSAFHDRVFVPCATARAKLKAFSKSAQAKPLRATTFEGIVLTLQHPPNGARGCTELATFLQAIAEHGQV